MPTARRRSARRLAVAFALIAAVASLALASSALGAPGVAFAPVSARNEPDALGGAGVVKGAAIDTFEYIVNVDNTGTTETRGPTGVCSPGAAGYPGSCHWTSIAGVPGSAPIATQGDQSDFANGATISLPDGRYLVSVLADGFKLDGEHFTVQGGAIVSGPRNAAGKLVVEMQPTPVPDSTVRAFVFQDNAPVNGQDDGNAEPGLPGFEGQLNDYLGQIVTDAYGNPLCTWYHGQDPTSFAIPRQDLDADGLPVPAEDERPASDPSSPGHCVSDADGILTIPHMGTNRYALSVIAPDGTDWVQTTTLEGNHDWDAWVMEGSTGFDTEFAVAGEPVPTPIFGFVRPTALSGSGTAHVKGVVDAMKVYVPAAGGLTNGGSIWGGLQGAKIDHPIDRPWIALSDLSGGDQAVYVGRGNADGSFDIANVPDGDYQITWWDDPQDYILDLQNVTVANGQVEDLGILPLAGWWTQFEGHVFNDLNANGKRDPGEPGVKDFGLVLKKRENSLMDRGTTGTTTAPDGSYYFEGAYPMTQWLVMEAYSDRYYTTGITYQADNQPTETTVLGAGVDVSVHPVIGLSGRLDWGVRPYAPNTNGGIVGTVSYDTTRNELDPRYAAVEDWQPGIPDLPVDLYEPVPCGTNAGAPCTTTPAGDEYEVEADGSYAKGRLLNQYVTENWQRPGLNDDGECIARDVNGDPLPFGSGQQVTNNPTDCLEAPLMGVQFQKGFSTVDGNYGFGDGCFTGDGFDPATGGCADGSDPTALPPGDYLVSVEIPEDAQGRPLYKVTREEDVNIGNGDQTVPQVPPPACAGPLHTVDVAGQGTDGYGPVTNADNPDVPAGVTVPASDTTDNPTFADIGGSPYEGQQRPLCDTKLVPLANQRSIAPTFNYFTDVPLPGRLWGLLVDDLNFSADKKSALYGEKAGIPFAPVGVYDYTNRLVTTVESDYNGLWDVLLPSTNRINCPTPSGVCSNLYRFVGNDPGVPGRLNPNFKPEFRTIATEFEVFPGLLVPADLAPTQVGVTVQLPNGQTHRVVCALDDSTPQLMAVSQPYVDTRTAQDTVTISGQGFGAAAGKVLLDDSVALPATAWSDTQITVSVPAATAQGPHQLDIVNQNGKKTVNGITFHVIGATYDPIVYEVGPDVANARYRPANTLPDTADHAIQNAIDDAEASTSTRPKLIVVHPGLATADNPRVNPRGAYYENLVVSEPLKIQGTGPGGVRSDGTTVPGAILDGSAFGGDSPVAGDWQTRVGGMTWAGNQNVNDGAVVTLFAATTTTFPATPTEANAPSIDGLDIRGGDQQGFPTNINQIGGGPTGLPPAIQTQGGAVFANGYARALRITNNVVENNGGAYGTIRIGTPDLPAPNTSNHDENVRIAKNRIIQNGGTNLAGGIGLFAGSDGYDVANNDICGNFSAEYGGGITAYGLSPNGRIHDNRIYFNTSYDEGGGIMIAGELPANPNALSPGSGPVSITHNQVQANLANDDGGGIRFLMAGNFAMNVSDNLIVNNVSAHEGGGVALDDAPQVRLVGNTIMKNLTTATAQTSNGLPAPAGLSTGLNSAQLQATLPSGSPTFSNPVQFDNVFWDNRAGSLDSAGAIVGLGAAGDSTPVNRWDMGTADGSGTLAPTNSVIQTPAGAGSYTDAASNVHADPAVTTTYDVSVDFAQWRTNPNFISPTMVAVDLPPNLLGDYHLSSGSPAINAGAASKAAPAPGSGTVAAPADDFDHEARPGGAAFDIGADEIPGSSADLALTNAPDKTAASPGQAMTYTVVVTNNGPSAVTAAPVTGTKATGSRLTLNGWTCTAGAGASCGAANGTITNQTAFGLGSVTLAKGATATITVAGSVNGTSASGSFTWTAAVAPPAGTTDPVTANNSAPAATVSIVGPGSDLSITKTRTQPTLTFGGPVTYTVTVTNNGPLSGTVTARVQDPVPAGLSGTTWTCDSTAPGSDCDTSGAMGTDVTTAQNGGIDRQVRLAGGASLTFTVNGTAAASGTLRNTATVTMTSGGNDRIPTNNTATDTATVPLTDVALPTLPILDRFNRANANTLGPDWNQVVLGGSATIRVNASNALTQPGLTPWGTWKPTLAAGQGAAFTFVNAPVNGSSLVLKGTGLITSTPTTYLRVQITGTNEVTVTSVLNGASTTRAVFAGSFAAGDRLAAAALGNGQVNVWKNSTLIGSVRIPTAAGNDGWTPGTGGGRIGIRLAIGQRIDDFSGGPVTP